MYFLNLFECKKFLIKRLDDEYGLSPAKSSCVLDILILALRGVKVQTLEEARKSIAGFQMCISVGYFKEGSCKIPSYTIKFIECGSLK